MRPYLLKEPHQATDECDPLHCYSHEVDELRIGTPYLICGECFHCFPSKHALRRDYRKTAGVYAWRELFASRDRMLNIEGFGRSKTAAAAWLTYRWVIKAKSINFCPHCLHDF